jgi:Tol biopolymer transport system component
MFLRTHTRRLLLALALATGLLLAASSAALGSSIVYLKGGNIWLASPDGANQYQVTFAGGYDQPSQAADGTIIAVRNGQFVRMDRSGRLLNPPADWFGNQPPPPGSNADQFFGPYHARVSPDGSRIAYAFKQREYDCDPITNVCDYQIVEYTTTSAVDHYAQASAATSVSRDGDPSWIDNTRVLVSDPFDPQQINTWVTGRGDDGEQWWFGGYIGSDGFGDLEREAALSPRRLKARRRRRRRRPVQPV